MNKQNQFSITNYVIVNIRLNSVSFLSNAGRLLPILLLCFSCFSASAQTKEAPIELVNPSFEGFPECCKTPTGWFDCAPGDETPPDIQPGQFSVATLPKHGSSYLGMVVRDNDTWESVGQRIGAPLQKDHCYNFAFDMARSETYISPSRKTQTDAHFTSAVKVRIWAGNEYCEKRELLAESSMVTNPRWLTFMFRLSPKKGTYNYIILETYYQTPVLFPYNGNVLLDNCTIIEPVDCATKPEIPPTKTNAVAVANTPVKQNPPAKKPATKPTATTSGPTPVAHSAPTNKFDRKKLKKGEVVRLERIIFKADSFEVQPESEPSLTEVYDFLKNNPDVIVEVGGHTNGIPPDSFCDELSSNRAKNVANWMIDRGISADRVKYKGYGKRQRIASDSTKEGRLQNQRVEIKILAMKE